MSDQGFKRAFERVQNICEKSKALSAGTKVMVDPDDLLALLTALTTEKYEYRQTSEPVGPGPVDPPDCLGGWQWVGMCYEAADEYTNPGVLHLWRRRET